MPELYGVDDEIPADVADEIIEVDVPVGPPDDEDTATVDAEPDDEATVDVPDEAEE